MCPKSEISVEETAPKIVIGYLSNVYCTWVVTLEKKDINKLSSELAR